MVRNFHETASTFLFLSTSYFESMILCRSWNPLWHQGSNALNFPRNTVDISICRAFKGPKSKFDNVRHLIFAGFLHVTPHQDISDMAKELCQVFHGLRHATINMQYLFSLFSPCRVVDHPDDHCSPIDNWMHLKSLDIQDFVSFRVNHYEPLMDWFMKRRNLGHRTLRLQLI